MRLSLSCARLISESHRLISFAVLPAAVGDVPLSHPLIRSSSITGLGAFPFEPPSLQRSPWRTVLSLYVDTALAVSLIFPLSARQIRKHGAVDKQHDASRVAPLHNLTTSSLAQWPWTKYSSVVQCPVALWQAVERAKSPDTGRCQGQGIIIHVLSSSLSL